MNSNIRQIKHLLLAVIALSIGLFVLYSSMLPNDITAANNSADGGDYLAAVLSDGVPHPSGYPTYLLVGKLFQLLPIGSPYTRQALASAFFAALAVGLVTLLSGLIIHTRRSPNVLISTLISGGVLGVAPFYWSQAVIVEVHGLQAFFVACFLLWGTLLFQTSSSIANSDNLISLLSILIGFGAGNHITILLAFPLIPFALYVGWRKGIKFGRILKYGALICLVGIGVYTYLPFLARNNPPINWGNAQTLSGLMSLVSGEIYHRLLFSIEPGEYLQRISAWSNLIMHQFGLLGILLGVIGAFRLHKTKEVYKWAYLWVFVVYSIFRIGYRTNDSITYLLSAIMVFSIWIGSGVDILLINSTNIYSLEKILIASTVFVLLVRIPSISSENDPRNDLAAKRFVDNCISNVPMDSIVITSADMDTFSLWYYQYGLGYREDISIIARGLMQYDWYHQNLPYTYPNLRLPDNGEGALERMIGQLNPGRSVCTTQIDDQGRNGVCICDQ